MKQIFQGLSKGQYVCAKVFLTSIEQGTASQIPIKEIFEVARITIEAAFQLRNNQNADC